MVPPVKLGEMKRESRSAGSAGNLCTHGAVRTTLGAQRTAPKWTTSALHHLYLLAAGLLVGATSWKVMGSAQNYDSRIYTQCAPWRGARGSSYTNVFRPAFVQSLNTLTDDYASQKDHLDGLDMGGNGANAPNFPALVGGVGGPALQAAEYRRKAVSAYLNRASKMQGLLARHIESKAVTEVIDTECNALIVAYRRSRRLV